MRRVRKGCGSRLHFRDKNSEAATIPLLGLFTPQVASQDVFMHMLSLTVDEAVDSAAFPTPRREVDLWECCISATTGKLSEDHSTSPTSPPNGSAAQGHLPLRTIRTQCTQKSHILQYLIDSTTYGTCSTVYLYTLLNAYTHVSNTYLDMITPVLLCHAFLKENRQWNTESFSIR